MNYLAAPITFVARNFAIPRAHLFLPRDTHFSLEDVPDLTGKVALVTGGSEGIGFACTKTLLERNADKVFVLSYRRSVYEEALKKLDQAKRNRVTWLQCDLAKWDTEVIAAADTITKSTSRLDIVIAAAARGIMPYEQDKHGIDLGMSVNHIGHVTLISHLLPLLKQTAQDHKDSYVRIVNLASMNHEHAPSDMTFSSVEDFNREIGPNEGYGRSKLAAILYARWMAQRLLPSNILFNSSHPGVVNTAQTIDWIHDAYPILGYAMSTVLYPFKKTPEQGCISTMFAATVIKQSGQYITPPATIEAGNAKSNDKEMGERLMKMTMQIITDRTDAAKKGCPVTAH